jgi:hypothetical protein
MQHLQIGERVNDLELFIGAVIQKLPVTGGQQTVPFNNTSLCLHLNVMAHNDAFILLDSYKHH